MIVDIIDKKRLGLELETDELKTIFNGTAECSALMSPRPQHCRRDFIF